MSRIFLSHSAVDELEAAALKQWLLESAWDDIFLDVDLTRNMSRKEWSDWVSKDVTYVCQCPGLPIPSDDAASGATGKACSEGKS